MRGRMVLKNEMTLAAMMFTVRLSITRPQTTTMDATPQTDKFSRMEVGGSMEEILRHDRRCVLTA